MVLVMLELDYCLNSGQTSSSTVISILTFILDGFEIVRLMFYYVPVVLVLCTCCVMVY